ncbi:MAG: hypothetical protein KF910_01545 [Brevundimonas sp.]|uniref:hypothetical protein n=1 Tax=Brevundimonas sp. TaxID=1871086 RepID=UPI0025C24651|nr:hypothetical protein [Brevundimonas sp.]MBX3476267.1 hypothetical protein [Brevundimonas sp.]
MGDHHDEDEGQGAAPHERPVDPFPTAFAPPPTSLFPPVADAPQMAAAPTPDDPPSDWNAGADAHDLPTRESPLTALGRFAFPPGPPLDGEGQGARDRRWTSRVIVFAALILVVFNAASAQNWSRQQAPGWGTETVRRLSDVWAEQIAQTGADRPRQWLHDQWRAWQEQSFGTGARDAAEVE